MRSKTTRSSNSIVQVCMRTAGQNARAEHVTAPPNSKPESMAASRQGGQPVHRNEEIGP
jgi:hypothetical protein